MALITLFKWHLILHNHLNIRQDSAVNSSKTTTATTVDSKKDISDINEIVPAVTLIFDAVTDNIIIHDNKGNPVYCNQAMLNTLKFESAQTFFGHLNNNQFPEYSKNVSKVLETKAPCSMIYNLGASNFSRYIYDLVSFFPIINHAQEIIGVFAYGRDLDYSKQKKIEKTKTQEHYLRSLLDSFPFAVWMKSKKGEFLTVNNQFCQDFGFKKPQDVLGKTDFDLFDQPMAKDFVEDDNIVMLSGEEIRRIEKIKCVNGNIYVGYTHKSPLRVDNKIVGTVGFTRDVSEEQRLQAEIAELENEYAVLINNLPIAIMVYDLDCRRILVNKFYSKLIRRDGNAFLGKKPTESWSQYIVNLTSEEYENSIKEVIKTGQPLSLDMFFTRDESGTTVHDVRLVARKNKSGETTGVIAIVQDITEIHESRLRNEYQANHDALTGLANRTLFSKQLLQATITAKQNDTAFAVMILDLDGFKSINDSMGHTTGDLLLKEVAKRLGTANSGQHLCTRLGGDEFAILYENFTHKRDVDTLAETILKDITNVYQIESAEYFISASIGIALYPHDTKNTDDLVKYADTAMYAAKDAGRNAYHFYDINLSKMAERRFHIEKALRYAIEHHVLFLEYQPIVDIASNCIVGVEALCRWQCKTMGFISPDEFIPVAEHTGLIIPLGKQLLQLAFQAAYQINHANDQVITVSVNLSARQFSDLNLVDTVLRLLNETQCNPKWIKFEITESLLLENNQQVLNALNAFNKLGIMIVLDDFGTGQSALGYLQKFPIQQIKIDRSFINEIEINPTSDQLVKAIIALVNSLDKELVAEGVETQIQANMIEQYGCKLAQGYLYSKSISLEMLLEYASKNFTI